MRFIEGDVVRISKDSGWYDPNYTDGSGDDDCSNPCNKTNGTIYNIHNESINVTWETEFNNTYDEEDLKLVRRP